MKKRFHISLPFSLNKQQQLTLPIFVVEILLNLSWIIYASVHGIFATTQKVVPWIVIGLLVYFVGVFFYFVPLITHHPGARRLLVGLNYLVAIPIAWIQSQTFGAPFLIINLCLLISLAVIVGRWQAYGYIFIAILAEYLVHSRIISYAPTLVNVDFFFVPIGSILITETLVRLGNSLGRETHRLQTLNNVARSLSSSLEMHQVIALVTSTIQSALSADTYYLGMVRGDSVHLELLYDDGEFFPSSDIPMKDTLAEKVIRSKKPLLIENLLPASGSSSDYTIVGQPMTSLSWMGCPLESEGAVFGIIAVASYDRYAFDDGDLDLLVNIAQQASVALTNAVHHTEVETRSKLNSLTGALNHNAFLSELDFHAREASTFQTPLSLIMLDIDRFKIYNDTYGHLVGDRVLVELTREIKRSIHKSDRVGRWGGEEFAIFLPDTGIAQAYQVANRICASLTHLTIIDRENHIVPCPTISQGIAELPSECASIEELVDLADRRLYRAKERGRDQIEPRVES